MMVEIHTVRPCVSEEVSGVSVSTAGAEAVSSEEYCAACEVSLFALCCFASPAGWDFPEQQR